MIKRSKKLEMVSYDIRGPIYQKSQEFAEIGIPIIQLNIGNPAPYGFQVPQHLMEAITSNLQLAQGYVHSNGIPEARAAIQRYSLSKGIDKVQVDDIYIGNGVSELISIALQALLNPKDEVLLPAPDYPLWTSTVNLCGGTPVHYICDEQSDWLPDFQDIETKITNQTKAIVLINPNNPTGAVYSKEVLERFKEIAKVNNLMLLSDEIYDRVLYDDAQHYSTAALGDPNVPCITFGGLSKNYMATGFRAGWMVISGKKHIDRSFFEGLDILMSMRLCSNAVAQLAIQPALEGHQHIDDMVLPKGRLKEQRDFCHAKLTSIPGISCVKPKGAMYMFPKIDTNVLDIQDDTNFILELLTKEQVLAVQGSGFNWIRPDHFRVTFLPTIDTLDEAFTRLHRFTQRYRREAITV